MKIVSKTHDYYDRAMGHGHDDHVLFLRNYEEYKNERALAYTNKNSYPTHLTFLAQRGKMLPLSFQHARTPSKDYADISLYPFWVLVAGKLYPGAQIYRTSKVMGENKTHYLYDRGEIESVLAEHDLGLDGKRKSKRTWWGGIYNFESLSYDEFFALKGSQVHEVDCIENGVVTAVTMHNYLYVNPVLAKYEFYRCLDAWQAFQEISMYLGNLASPDNTPVTISDKDRIMQHGFDKYSFRKAPSK